VTGVQTCALPIYALKLLDRPAHATRDKNLDPTEHAAWTQLVITVLASDAALCLN
jgi:hypothetical protein